MRYHVEFSERARKDLKKLDRYTAMLILGWVRKNLEGCADPRLYGKSLVGDHAGEWRYRVGDYRLLAQIRDDQVLILVVHVGHRKEVYRS
ncbi:MAG: type II toxin-antitoxin system RelE/ParE family toxin [Lachnospiraceae bacterium]|nr:type II toxin-antitoxin system RelE/ParE family toxin [Lachnospiraceae bacterium]